MIRKRLTPAQVYQKLKHYCAWQERSLYEVRIKAGTYGLRITDIDRLAAQLEAEGCINEERFARQFAGGKFRMKQWGRVKIRAELKKKRINDHCITASLNQLSEQQYRKTIEKLALQKWNSIKGEGVNHFVKMTKTRSYLLQKGYEPALIKIELAKLSAK